MTVGDDRLNERVGFADGVTGSEFGNDPFGSLGRNGFRFKGADYTVGALYVVDTGRLALRLGGALTQAAAARLDLYVGGTRFRFAGANEYGGSATDTHFHWHNAGLTLPVGGRVPVLIVEANSSPQTAADPLAAQFRDPRPASHDGSTPFRFGLAFSEEFPVSAETLRDHAFDVTGGSVTAAEKVDRTATGTGRSRSRRRRTRT